MKQRNFLIKKNIYNFVKYYWKMFLGMGVLIGFLLFLLNIFIGISTYTHSFSNSLNERLGMYFYIKETPETQSEVYKKVIELQSNLHKEGLRVMFSSKEDAVNFLANKLPDINDNFNKFGIENPLPAALYVMFKSNKEYEILKTNILKYKDIILNIKDISQDKTIQQQENMVLNIININNFVNILSIFIVVLLGVVIFTFLGYQTYFILQYLRRQIELKTLLGGSYLDMVKEFFLINLSSLTIGFIICLILLIITRSVLGVSLYEVFGIGLLDIFKQSHMGYLLLGFLSEFLLFVISVSIFSYVIIYKRF